jgi:hypothetical protein
MNEYLTYRKFNSLEELSDLKDLFNKNKIEYIIEDTLPAVDLSFSGNNTFEKDIRIKIKSSDFDIADKLLEDLAGNMIGEIDKDNYLLEFTNEELLEIIEKPDEWSKSDFFVAQNILKNRGVDLTKEKIEDLKRERLNQLAQPEKGQTGWIVAGYIAAILGGFLGVFTGWHLLTFKKTLPNGQRVYEYDTTARNHGQKILIIGIVCLIFWICFTIYYFIK